MSTWRIARLIAAKDLRIELRSRVVTNQVLPFAALVMVMFAFARSRPSVMSGSTLSAVSWLHLISNAGSRNGFVIVGFQSLEKLGAEGSNHWKHCHAGFAAGGANGFFYVQLGFLWQVPRLLFFGNGT